MTAPGGPLPPIPFTLLTGFLGAGKTTLLNALLRDPALAETVVIVNEIGEIGLDHLLVETIDGDTVLLQAGCLCCTIRGDLVTALENLLRRRDNGRIPPFRRVIVETTGLAEPAPILHGLLAHPYLSRRYAVDRVVAVVDAVNGAATLDAHPEAVRQAAMADVLVVTKRDLPEAARTWPSLRARLEALNPGAQIVEVAQGGGVETLLASGTATGGSPAELRRWLGTEAVAAAERSRHGRRFAPADDGGHLGRIRSFCLTSHEPIRRGAFELFLDLLRSAHGPKLLRVKGLVGLADDPDRPVVVHAVQHVVHVPEVLAAWPDADRSSRLVFIVQDLDRDFVERLWDAFLGRPGVDQPDAAAYTDNPLSLRR